MITTKSAKKQLNVMKKAAIKRMDNITTTEKLAGAAVLGVAVGAVVTAASSALLKAHPTDKVAKSAKKTSA